MTKVDQPRRNFITTRWSLVLAAATPGGESSAQDALAQLCEAYWYPLYAYLRGHGHQAEDAQDLTQAFFARLLEKHVIRQADPARGRFRGFLLASLKNFVSNQHDRDRAAKRGGGVAPLPLEFDAAEGRLQRELPTNETPERIFDRRWARTLLDRGLTRLVDEHGSSTKRPQFEQLKPYLTGEETVASYAETALHLDMSEGAVKVAVHRLRRRFRDLIHEEIAQTVSSPADIEDELRHLWSALKG